MLWNTILNLVEAAVPDTPELRSLFGGRGVRRGSCTLMCAQLGVKLLQSSKRMFLLHHSPLSPDFVLAGDIRVMRIGFSGPEVQLFTFGVGED
jgi:hypothetical protein